MDSTQSWIVVLGLALGTFLIRYSFIGLFAVREPDHGADHHFARQALRRVRHIRRPDTHAQQPIACSEFQLLVDLAARELGLEDRVVDAAANLIGSEVEGHVQSLGRQLGETRTNHLGEQPLGFFAVTESSLDRVDGEPLNIRERVTEGACE